MNDDLCPIWKTPCEATYDGENDLSKITSWRAGGRYKIDSLTALGISDLGDVHRANLSDLIYESNQRGEVPLITRGDIAWAKESPPRVMRSRLERLLLQVGAKERHLGDHVIVPLEDAGIFCSAASARNPLELDYLLDALKSEGLIARTGMSVQITPAGHALLADLRGVQGPGVRAFVAMWFDASMDTPYRSGFEPAIRSAGYDPIRIDKKDHNNKIDDEIIAELRRSRFVVADFTCAPQSPRGGVYFEAGFAQGLGIPVIWTCRADCIKDLHFDTRQYNHIVWSDASQLRDALSKRIVATLGQGTIKGSKA